MNVIHNTWVSGQVGFAVLFKSTNQGGGCTWCTTQDVTARFNYIKNAGAGFNLAGHPETFPVVDAARLTVYDNFTDSVNVGIFKGPGDAFQLLGVDDVVMYHNTTLNPTGRWALGMDGRANQRTVYYGNVGGGEYGIFGSNKGSGALAIAFYLPGSLITYNVLYGNQNCSVYPATTLCPASPAVSGVADDNRPYGADTVQLKRLTAGVVVAP
jgi:hypothetical protein